MSNEMGLSECEAEVRGNPNAGTSDDSANDSETFIPDAPMDIKPRVGMEFASEEDAYECLQKYACTECSINYAFYFLSVPKISVDASLAGAIIGKRGVNSKQIVRVIDGIKELDEGLLSELEAVGDFSVQGPKSDAVEAEMQLQSEPDAEAEYLIHVGIKNSIPELQILQAESVETFGIERSAEPRSVIDQPNSESELIQFPPASS